MALREINVNNINVIGVDEQPIPGSQNLVESGRIGTELNNINSILGGYSGTPDYLGKEWQYSLSSAGEVQSMGNTYIIPVLPGKIITIESDYNGAYSCLKSDPESLTVGQMADYCEGENRKEYSAGTIAFTLPQDCQYIVITRITSTEENHSPKVINIGNINNGLISRVASLEVDNFYIQIPNRNDKYYRDDYIINDSGEWYATTNGIWLIPIPEKITKLRARINRESVFGTLAFLKSINNIGSGVQVDFSGNGLETLTNDFTEFAIPADAKYLYLIRYKGGILDPKVEWPEMNENYLFEETFNSNDNLNLLEAVKDLDERTVVKTKVDCLDNNGVNGYVDQWGTFTFNSAARGLIIDIEGYDYINVIPKSSEISNISILSDFDFDAVQDFNVSFAYGYNSRKLVDPAGSTFEIPSNGKYAIIPHYSTSNIDITPESVTLYKKTNIVEESVTPINNTLGIYKSGTPDEVGEVFIRSIASDGRIQEVGQSSLFVIPVLPNSRVVILTSKDTDLTYSLLKASPLSIKVGFMAKICDNCEPRYTTSEKTIEIITPPDCNYITVPRLTSTGSDISPDLVSVYRGVLGDVADLKESSSQSTDFVLTPSEKDNNYIADYVISASSLSWISGLNGVWLIKIPEGIQTINVKSITDKTNCFAFLKSNRIVLNQEAPFSEGTSLISLTEEGEDLQIPTDAKYIYVVRFGAGSYVNPKITFYDLNTSYLFKELLTESAKIIKTDAGQVITSEGEIILTNMPDIAPISDPLKALASGESNFYHEVATGLVYMVCVEGFDHPYEAFDCCSLYIFSLTNPNNVKRYQVAQKIDNNKKCYTNNIVYLSYKKVRIFYTIRFEDSGYCYYRDFDFSTETFTEPQKTILAISGDITSVTIDSSMSDGDILTGNMVKRFTDDNGGTTGVNSGQFVYIQKITEVMSDNYRYATLCCGESISYNLLLVRSNDNFVSLEFVAVLPYLTRYDCAVAGLNNKLYFVHRVAGDEYAATSGSALFTADITDLNNIVWSVDTKFAEGDSRTDCYYYKNKIYLMAGNLHSVEGQPRRVSSSVWEGTSDNPDDYKKVLTVNDTRGVQNPRILRYGAGDYGVLMQNSPARVDFAAGQTSQWQFKTAVCFVHSRIN